MLHNVSSLRAPAWDLVQHLQYFYLKRSLMLKLFRRCGIKCDQELNGALSDSRVQLTRVTVTEATVLLLSHVVWFSHVPVVQLCGSVTFLRAKHNNNNRKKTKAGVIATQSKWSKSFVIAHSKPTIILLCGVLAVGSRWISIFCKV